MDGSGVSFYLHKHMSYMQSLLRIVSIREDDINSAPSKLFYVRSTLCWLARIVDTSCHWLILPLQETCVYLIILAMIKGHNPTWRILHSGSKTRYNSDLRKNATGSSRLWRFWASNYFDSYSTVGSVMRPCAAQLPAGTGPGPQCR